MRAALVGLSNMDKVSQTPNTFVFKNRYVSFSPSVKLSDKS